MRRVSLLTCALSVGVLWAAAQPPEASEVHWVGTWGASPAPQLAGLAEMTKSKLVFANQTVREIVHISVGGPLLRVRLSNTFGKQAVEIGAAHIAIQQKGPAIAPGSDRALTFGGRTSVTIPPNALVLSDPVALTAAPAADLAISIFLPKSTLGAGIHYGAQQTNYVAAGDLTSAATMPNPTTVSSWVFLTGIDIAAPQAASTLVTFGDSITDGYASSDDANHRWPNFLAERLAKQSDAPAVGVLDEGIGGNRILHDSNQTPAFGVSALARYDRDVLAQPGLKYIVVLEGINDLGHAGPNLFPNEQVTADDIIAGLKQLIERAHENGVKIYGGTLTPFIGTVFPGYYSDAKEKLRKAVNDWIRTSHAFDAVIDFEKAVEDPANPGHMTPAYDSGDHLHPNDSGYKAMADAVDLSLFH